MLLKVYTYQNTIKIISNIEDVEIHEISYKMDTWNDIYDSNAIIGGFRYSDDIPQVQSWDWQSKLPNQTIDLATQSGALPIYSNIVHFIDYQKSGKWHRVAVQKFAYLCNDDGKTIAKI